MREEINRLKEERAKALEEARAIVLSAESEGLDLTAEDAEKFDKLEAAADSLEKRAARLEKLSGIEPLKRQVNDPQEDKADEAPEWVPEEMRDGWKGEAPSDWKGYAEMRARAKGELSGDTDEYRMAFFRWMSVKDVRMLTANEVRVLSKASAGAGLNLVPTSFERQLLDSLRTFGVMRDISNVISTSSGEALQIPTVSSHGSASWTAENAAFSASDEAFGQATLNAYKAATLMKVSEELLADAAFDLESFIRQQFGYRIGVIENTAYVAGDGSGKPTGVATQASAGVVAASATAVTAGELIDLYHSLAPPYRRNAVWVLNDSSIKLVRKLADTTGQFIWNPGLQAGAPDTLLGKPVYADPDMAAATTGLISVLFGDFSYYWIRDVNGIAFQRLNELYAENGQVGFRAFHRTDGKLMNTAAVKKLTML